MSERSPSPEQIMDELLRLRARGGGHLDRLALLHEISVYQEELIAQNEALIRAQSTLEDTRDRFVELYDFAPNGYLTLDDHGVIRQCNLTTAVLFGRSKQALEGVPLLGFVEVGDRPLYLDLLRRSRGRCRHDLARIGYRISGVGVDQDRDVITQRLAHGCHAS